MSEPINIRVGTRADLPYLTLLNNKVWDNNPVQQCVDAEDKRPADYQKILLMFRTSFVNPRFRYVVAEDSTGRFVGLSAWLVVGDCDLATRWSAEAWSWSTPVEQLLNSLESRYRQVFVRQPTDPLAIVSAAANEDHFASVKPHLFCISLIVMPELQGRGLGKRLLAWGTDLSRQEGLPIALTSTPEAWPLYRKAGFKTLKVIDTMHDADGNVTYQIPVMLWEPEQLRGKWLDIDENDETRATLKQR